MQGGKTIAHGYLTMSLFKQLQDTILDVRNVRRAINYGANKVRFISPVPVGSRVRLVCEIIDLQVLDGGAFRTTTACTIEIEGEQRPALAMEVVGLLFA
jgi:acyl dehydratase